MAAHALLGPSKADQFINCPPSMRATEHIEDVSSAFAEEGTLIHALGEVLLRAWIDNEGVAPDYELDTLRASKYYSEEVQNAADEYVAYVQERYRAALAKDPSAQIRIERRVDLTDAIPEGFGTADCSITYLQTVESIDLKGGRGVYVSAFENAQTRLYAYGVVKQVEILYDVTEVICTIVQPRMSSITSETLTRTELFDWVDRVVKPAAALAWAGKGEFKAGEWCQWCKIKGTCKVRAGHNVGEVAELFKLTDSAPPGEYQSRSAPTLTPAEIGVLLPKLDAVRKWIGEIQEAALASALSGTAIPGFKIVRGRANRVITNPEALADALVKAGVPEGLIYDRSLVGITELSRRIGKAKFDSTAAPYIDKPPGKPTLTYEADRRDAINNVAETAALFSGAANE